MPSTKRSFQAEDDGPSDGSLLQQIRGMWQFANVVEWIYIFGKAVKIDEDIDVETMETELLKPTSAVLQDVALALVKTASSFRGINIDGLNDQMRKLYNTYAPDRNPFGTDDMPHLFDDLDCRTKIRVLQQLTQWVMRHPERFRDKMEEQRDTHQTSWRIEPYGWDSEDRTYFVLDDNRLYRMTDAPPAPPPQKKAKKTKTYARNGRRSSRRAAAASPDEDMHAQDDDVVARSAHDDGLGGMLWECIAVTLDEVQSFLSGIAKTRDENEKILRNQIREHLLPILEKQEESRKRREQQRERELLNLAKMANAKRSSRLAGKAEQIKQQEENDRARKEEERQREAEKREERERQKREQERDFRLASREERLRERETRRRLHEEELAQLSEDSRHLSEGNGRVSERRLQAEIEKNQQALKELEEEEEDWIFDCVCGLYGRVDDGSHSVACERCNIWQHSKCVGISEAAAERSDFHFLCSNCSRREAAKHEHRPPIKLKVHGVREEQPHSIANAQLDRPHSQIVVELPAALPSSSLPKNVSAQGFDGQKDLRSAPDTAAQTISTVSVTAAPNDAQTGSPPATHASAAASQAQSTPKMFSNVDAETAHHILPHGNALQTIPTTNGHSRSPAPHELKTPVQTRLEASSPSAEHLPKLTSTPSLVANTHKGAFSDSFSDANSGGLSPVKHSPHPVVGAAAMPKLTMSPLTNLAPAPSPQNLTPPVKSFESKKSGAD